MPETFVKVYIGADEDFRDLLCVDLVVKEKCFTLWSSENSLDELGGEEFLSVLETAVNLAVFLKTSLRLKLDIDSAIGSMSEDYDVNSGMRIRKFLKEVL